MMTLRLNEAQALQTIELIHTLRPDWRQHDIGSALHAANYPIGIRHAADYGHLIRALAQYATQPDAHGQPFGRDFDGFLKAGAHWTTTAPKDFDVPRGPKCRTHDWEYEPCRACRADQIAEKPQEKP